MADRHGGRDGFAVRQTEEVVGAQVAGAEPFDGAGRVALDVKAQAARLGVKVGFDHGQDLIFRFERVVGDEHERAGLGGDGDAARAAFDGLAAGRLVQVAQQHDRNVELFRELFQLTRQPPHALIVVGLDVAAFLIEAQHREERVDDEEFRPGFRAFGREQVEIARQLQLGLGVAIGAGFPTSPRMTTLAISTPADLSRGTTTESCGSSSGIRTARPGTDGGW